MWNKAKDMKSIVLHQLDYYWITAAWKGWQVLFHSTHYGYAIFESQKNNSSKHQTRLIALDPGQPR